MVRDRLVPDNVRCPRSEANGTNAKFLRQSGPWHEAHFVVARIIRHPESLHARHSA